MKYANAQEQQKQGADPSIFVQKYGKMKMSKFQREIISNTPQKQSSTYFHVATIIFCKIKHTRRRSLCKKECEETRQNPQFYR